MAKLSAVILAKNEEKRIRRCLEAVRWADEIVVVDDESTDTTAAIARECGATVYVRKMEIEGTHRNWAYAQARHPWILSVDADEVVTPELREQIKQTLAVDPAENGFTIPRRNFIGPHWIRYGGWYPSPQLKLFRKDKFRYEEVAVHPRAFMDDPCGRLSADLLHYSYRDIEDFVAKLNRQTSWEARKWHAQNKPMRLGRFLWRSYDRFMRSYFGRQGYREGFWGFVTAYFAGLYQFLSYLKYREIVRANDTPPTTKDPLCR